MTTQFVSAPFIPLPKTDVNTNEGRELAHTKDPSHRGFKNVLAKALRIIFETPV